ncbi:MAG: hypothetical protein L3K17_10730 [Thermoplasmata archaeon]|nr:hypothetical protein [Thermoplasmata archaeon]
MERKWVAETEPRPETGPGPRPEGARRLQRMGTVTMGVSLPREWVGEHGLAVGSPVYLRPLADGSILLRDRTAHEHPRVAEIQVRIDRPREHLFRRLVAAYLDGAQEFQVIELAGLSAETRSIARAFVRRTVQPEIVTEDGDRLLLRDVSRGGDLDLAPLLRRMHQVVQRLQEEAGASLGGASSRASPEEWTQRDDEVDRHAWLIERILTLHAAAPGSGTPTSFGAIPQVLVVVRSLERVADHAVQIAEHGTKWAESSPPTRLVRSVTEFHAQARRLLADAFSAAESGDADAANDLLDTGEALHEEYRTLVGNTLARRSPSAYPGPGIVDLALLLQSIDRTAAYAQDIAEAGLDSGVRGQLQGGPPTLSRSSPVERGGMRKR